jgi:hypothetical protein
VQAIQETRKGARIECDQRLLFRTSLMSSMSR